ncbi:MAG TPA: hypothetical protein VF762_05365, partial [Blastocatellia bacterium]
GEMFKYLAQAPLVFKSTDTRLIEAGEAARQAKNSDGDKNPDRREKPSVRRASRLRALAYGESISWTRPVVRASQRVAKESLRLFILVGAAALLLLSGRRWLCVMMVPLYYMLVQSLMHTEFRYTLPMQYFIFIFAATAWVLVGRAVWVGLRSVAGLRDRDRAAEPAASV